MVATVESDAPAGATGAAPFGSIDIEAPGALDAVDRRRDVEAMREVREVRVSIARVVPARSNTTAESVANRTPRDRPVGVDNVGRESRMDMRDRDTPHRRGRDRTHVRPCRERRHFVPHTTVHQWQTSTRRDDLRHN
jgi:hypothetical protein